MEPFDWAARWRDGQIGFHQSNVNGFLETHADEVWGSAPLRRVYVPLCGKSLDLVSLADRAADVVGVEFVEQAVQEFFAERGLDPAIETEPFTRYHADGYTIFAADFFALCEDHLGPVDAVFDRAALVALDAPARIRYADHLRSLLAPGATMFLITFDYDQAEMNGPPFAVSPDEVQRLFGDGFDIRHLETRDALDEAFRARGLPEMRESAYALTRR